MAYCLANVKSLGVSGDRRLSPRLRRDL